MAVTRETLLAFLSKKTRADLSKIEDGAELFSSGVVDSFVMVDLMMWLEKQTGARLNPADVNLDNFDSVQRILAYAASRAR
ncbi:acyl carrier protein [Enhygromyxa salina]|uniref:D-alanine--poly(Phosphoribitol) ligase subunit 2 n=1 Tax=Enhygromyxa salina TaxID=215803 RepID=A0A2S9YN82_9BACT|nr:acyl carrier protein [Enhygromyxa salina]PRQ06550.1 D-alanine--poly(phosphoribitol) ligase subunit 2 [Enhygromyxa salina]